MSGHPASTAPPGASRMAGRVRAFDWSRTPLGPIEGWPPELRTATMFVLESGFPAALAWGPELVTIYNDGFRPILGDKPEALGRPFLEVWAEVRDAIAPIVARALAGEATFIEDFPAVVDRRGAPEEAWFTFSYSPVRTADGAVAGFIDTVVETTERVRTQRALREGEARFRAFVTASSDVVYRMSPDWAEMRQLDGCDFLSDTPEPSGTWMERYIHPDDQPAVRAAIRAAIDGKGLFELEHRVRRADGGFGWTLSRAVPILDGGGRIVEWLGAAKDVTRRRRVDETLRDSGERQAFLLDLSDRLRPLADASDIEGEVCRRLAEHLDTDRAHFVEFDEAAGIARIGSDHVRGGAASLAGPHAIADFAWSTAILRRGECYVVADARTSPLVPDRDRPACAAVGVVACMGAPLIEAGSLVGALCVTTAGPRDWRAAEVALLREVGERVWAAVKRARAESALRDSEELFRSFAENSTDTLWILDAATGRLDFLSPAFAAMYGEDPERVAADFGRFLDLVHPDDRERVAAAMPALLAGGVTNRIEYRIRRPGDGTVRWIQDTGFPIRDAAGRIARAGGVAQDVTGRHEAEETLRQSEAQLQVMVAELHHRTRNLIGVVGTIARQLIDSSVSLADFRDRFTARLGALSRVQSLLSRKGSERSGIGDIVGLELDALGADLAHGRVAVDGEPVPLRKAAIRTLSLAIHELATNARKYGALSGDAGRLLVRWETYAAADGAPRLRLEWTETGIAAGGEAPDAPPRRRGHGRKLIEEALPYMLKAKTTYALGRDRLDCTIDMPLGR